MPSGERNDDDDVAADLLNRWQAHHAGAPQTAPPARHTPKHMARPDDGLRDATLPVEAPVEAPVVVGQDAVPELRSRPTARLETGSSTDVEFPPRTGIRLLVGLFLLALVAATAFAVYVAFDDPTTLTVGMAGTLGVLTLLVYATRAGSTPTRLAIRSGQLEIVRGSTRELYDLSSRYTPVEIVGKPGHRDWKVLIGRVDREPEVIDASMVDPTSFTEAVRRHRPTPQP